MPFEMNPNPPLFTDNEVITLTRNGVWMSDGEEIEHEQTIRAFTKSLKRDEQGHFIQIGRETKRIQVEDTAYFVTRIDGSVQAGIELVLNDETRERLDPKTLAYRPGRLTCRVHEGAEEAKFLSAPYFELLRELQEDERTYYLVLQGKRVELAVKS